MIAGVAALLRLRETGLLRSVGGRAWRAALIGACTAGAAASVSRSRANCRLTRAVPLALTEVISLPPAINPKRRSNGVVTVLAMVSGLAPGMLAETEIAG